jgi:ABC-type lipoprotein release transport system permease subunit
MPLRASKIANGVNLIVRVPGAPEQFVPELRRIATAVDPTLRMGTAATLGRLDDGLGTLIGVSLAGFGLVFLSVLLLCSAGVFALMSFNVTQRRREIGVRSALGAHPRRVLFGIIGGAARQLAIGVAVGLAVVIALPPLDLDGITLTATAGPIAFVALVMVGVGLLAAVGPARRGLRIHPSEALREG